MGPGSTVSSAWNSRNRGSCPPTPAGRKTTPTGSKSTRYRISDIVERIADVAEQAILREGGRRIERDGEIVYIIPPGK